MRILFLSDFYPPVLGGLELQVQALARGLARRGHHVSVATLTLDAPSSSTDCGATVYRVRGWNRLLAPIYMQRERPYHLTMPDPGVVAGLRRILQRERPDVVSAHSWILYSFLPLKRSTGARLAVRLHDYSLVCPKKTFIHRGAVCTGPEYVKCLRCASAHYGTERAFVLTTGLGLMRPFVARETDVFIANSTDVADASHVWTGQPRSAIAVVPPFIPNEAPRDPSHPRPQFLPPDGDFLMFAGSLKRDKGIDVLLQAYAQLDTTIPLVLVGMPSKEMPRQLPKGVTVATNVERDEVLAAWPHCAIAIVPSLSEAFGVVAVEAMAAGRPVIASAVGGLKDVVRNEETGLLVPPGDAVALRHAIARLLDNPAERKRMGAAGRELCMSFSESRILPEMERLMEGV